MMALTLPPELEAELVTHARKCNMSLEQLVQKWLSEGLAKLDAADAAANNKNNNDEERSTDHANRSSL